MSRNIPAAGMGGQLIITRGYGWGGIVVPPEAGPADIILDHVSRAKDLFVHQFRKLRDLTLDPVIVADAAPSHTPVDPTPEASQPILTHVALAKALFVSQFRRLHA